MTIQSIIKRGNIMKNIEHVDRIAEVALIDFLANDAVEELTIIQTLEGTFILVAKLSWKKELSVLVTSRNTVREWVEHKRLVKHIESKYPKLPIIKVILNYKYTVGEYISPNIKKICFDTELANQK